MQNPPPGKEDPLAVVVQAGDLCLGSSTCGKKFLGDRELNVSQQCTPAPKTASSVHSNINGSPVGQGE